MPKITARKWWWPPARKRAKSLQALADHIEPEITEKVHKAQLHYLKYGEMPVYEEWDDGTQD